MNGPTPLLLMSGIGKSFGATPALDSVSFDAVGGEVHALCGENGAGKSTLMKILGGHYPPDTGEIRLDGRVVRFAHPIEAARAGIGIVHQELSLLPDRSVAENIFLGREPRRFGLLDRPAMERQARALLSRLDCAIDPARPCRTLSLGERQLVEIAKALGLDARILVLDEPTAALDRADADRLMATVRRLREANVAVIYVSHRMPEIMALADRVSVLKDGRLVGTEPRHALDVQTLVRMMVGRELAELYPDQDGPAGAAPLLELSNCCNRALRDISLALHAGEIVGVAGLDGSGRTALLRAIFGDTPFTAGALRLRGVPVAIRSSRAALAAGIGFVPEDRRSEALLLRRDVRDNVMLGRHALSPPWRRARGGALAPARVDRRLAAAGVRAARYDVSVAALSGGNQQKVILARVMANMPDVLLVAEPTRGVDVAAKAAIYRTLRDHVRNGRAVLFSSSDLPEVLGLSDRVVVMRAGSIAGVLGRGASEEAAMALAVGSVDPARAA